MNVVKKQIAHITVRANGDYVDGLEINGLKKLEILRINMSIKIAIIGTSGTGKTTLTKKLKRGFTRQNKKVEIIDEVTRKCPWNINEQAEFICQSWIFHEQIRKELEIEYKNPDIIIYDRNICDNLAYMERVIDTTKDFPIIEFLQLVEIARYWSYKYDYIIYMPLNLQYLKEDGVRSVNEKFTKDIDWRIRRIIKNFDLDVIKYRKNFNVNKFCNKVVV